MFPSWIEVAALFAATLLGTLVGRITANPQPPTPHPLRRRDLIVVTVSRVRRGRRWGKNFRCTVCGHSGWMPDRRVH